MNKYFDPSLWNSSQSIGYLDPFGTQQQSLFGSLGGDSGNTFDRNGQRFVQVGGVSPQHLRDPGSVDYDPEHGYSTPFSNWNMQGDNWFDRYGVAIMAAAMGGLIASGAGLGAAGAEAGSGAAGAFDASGITPSLYGNGVEPFTGVAANANPNYWGMLADSGQTASDAGYMGMAHPGPELDGYMGALGNQAPQFNPGGLDPETWGGMGGMSAGQNGITGAPSWMQQLGGMITNNPGQAFRGALGLSQLVGSLGGRGNNSGGSDPSSGLLGGAAPQFTPYQGQFTPNPYLNSPVPFMGRGY